LFWKFVFWTFNIVSDFGFRASGFSSRTGFSVLHCAVVLGYGQDKVSSAFRWIDSVQLMFGYRPGQPLDYCRLVIVVVQVMQVIGIQRPGTAQNLPERSAFDSIYLTVTVLPKSFCRSHSFALSKSSTAHYFSTRLSWSHKSNSKIACTA
jgi:hypothetical protein